MNRTSALIRTAAISTLLCWMQSAFAQPSGFVNVGRMNVVETIATNIPIESSRIPSNVRVPVDIAAHGCQGGRAKQARRGARRTGLPDSDQLDRS